MLELFAVDKKLAVAEYAIGQADNLAAIRTITYLPKGNPIANPIRPIKIREPIEASGGK